jgi:hypothetical protein
MQQDSFSYYVGDLGYALTSDQWNEAISLVWDNPEAGCYELGSGIEFWMRHTDSDDFGGRFAEWCSYSTDSGMVGIIRTSDINSERLENVEAIVSHGMAQLIDIHASSVSSVISEELLHFLVIPLAWRECTSEDIPEMIARERISREHIRYLIDSNKVSIYGGGIEACMKAETTIFESLQDDSNPSVEEFAKEVILHSKLPDDWRSLMPWEKDKRIIEGPVSLDVLRIFALSRDEDHRMAVASSESTTKELLEALSVDENSLVSYKAELSINGPMAWRRLSWDEIVATIKTSEISPELLKYLSTSPFEWLRAAIVDCPNASSEVLESLTGDSSSKICYRARKRLEERS